MIKTENLNKVYRTEEVETRALNNVNLHIKAGEFVSIMGPSGCGKSTLLNILGLLDDISKGSYLFDGQEMAQLKEAGRSKVRKQNIGFIFQNFNLIDELNVFENIELPIIYNGMNSSERKKKVEEIMDRMNISHRTKHFPQQLSGGQQQRVAVARALVTEPKLILADEPTGNLDSRNGNEVMELLTDLHAKGATILMVTHSDYDASFSQRTIHMKDGMIFSEKHNQRNVDVLVDQIRSAMLKSWIKIFVYHLRQNKLFSFLNTLGLAIGISGITFAVLYWNDEHAFNATNPNKDRIFQVVNDVGGDMKWPYTMEPAGRLLKAESPGLKAYCFTDTGYMKEAVHYNG